MRKKNLSKEAEDIQNQTCILEVKNTVTESENLIDGLDSRMEGTDERTRELEGRTINRNYSIWATEKKIDWKK